jgi:hypothetical protein
MSFSEWTDVEERQEFIVLCDSMTRNVACDDLAEYASHDVS